MRQELITASQTAYLAKLIHTVGKQRYQATKERLGFSDTTIMELSKNDASKLIRELIMVKNYPQGHRPGVSR